MRDSRPLFLLALLCGPAAWAQTSTPEMVGLCHDATTQDRQPNFATLNLKDLTSTLLTTDSPPALRLNTNLEALNPERIYFPFPQQVRISYLYESAGNSTALGYFYYQDMVDRGYINKGALANDSSDDSLADNDGDGIADFHEDLFRLSRDPTNQTSRYNRRCTQTFDYTYGSKTTTLYVPELASKDCGNHVAKGVEIDSAGVVRKKITVDLVGQHGNADGDTQFGDNGLYRSVPNLLEPRDAKNNLQGIGHLIFLHSDDDDDYGTGANLGPVGDATNTSNGIPDYNVSAYDADGRLLSPVPDNDVEQENDRTVNLGELQGDREIVFYVVSWGSAGHNPSSSPGGTVLPCLGFKFGSTDCGLHMLTPTNVYFSKTFLNLDQNSVLPTPTTVDGKLVASVAERSIGCAYGSSCQDPKDSTRWLGGWLDGATLERLKTVPAYNNLVMPNERVVVKADTSTRGMMPHVLVGAPSTDKYRWVLGFEDLPGGGDRDFNDVSFMVHKSNGGRVRSAVVSGDLSPSIAQDFTITEVTFGAEDEAYYSSSNPSFCASRPAGEQPRIRYQVALDCQVCTSNCSTNSPTMEQNPNPTWVDVPLKDNANGRHREKETVTLRDFLERGLTGSQLCWQAIMESKRDECQPTIRNINVFYKAVRSGDYGRAAVLPAANAVLYGTFETPGRKWLTDDVKPSVRVVDGKPDMADRGHLYLKELYRPEKSTELTGKVLWDSGDKLSSDVQSSAPLDGNDWRKLITMNPSGKRVRLNEVLNKDTGGEAFSSSNCGANNGGNWLCDLNRSGGRPDGADQQLLSDWLYGWEKRTGTKTGTKRTWPMGGVQLSTPALVTTAIRPSWLQYATGLEQSDYITNFAKDARVSSRPTVAYVGTTQGFFHGITSGSLILGDDPCTKTAVEANGYFKVKAQGAESCPAAAAREYGDAKELFAYMPRKLLPTYVRSYLRTGEQGAAVDATPSVMDMDLGFGTYSPTKGFPKKSDQPAWTIGDSTNVKPTEGAKTVAVSSTGADHSVVFALDITDPANKAFYPLPMWEFDMSKDTIDFGPTDGKLNVESAFADLGIKGKTLLPDTHSSRHAIPLVRMDVAGGAGMRWVAVVGTDYVPNPNTGGTIYLLDMKTGQPVQVPGDKAAAKVAGVIPLEADAGIAGFPVAMDVNTDGLSELIYAATTKGNIYRIATNKVDVGSKGEFGRMFQVCQVADVRRALINSGKAEYATEAKFQGIFSNIAVQNVGSRIRIFVGTGNNPDASDDDADKQTVAPHSYMLAFEDTQPMGKDCPVLYTPNVINTVSTLWIKQLDAGQTIWGGLVVAKDGGEQTVNTTTAVGKAANACSLSSTQSGKLYSVRANDTQPTGTVEGISLGGHSLASPVVHDGKLLTLTAHGKVQVNGDPSQNNLGPATGGPDRVRIQMWDADPTGAVKP